MATKTLNLPPLHLCQGMDKFSHTHTIRSHVVMLSASAERATTFPGETLNSQLCVFHSPWDEIFLCACKNGYSK